MSHWQLQLEALEIFADEHGWLLCRRKESSKTCRLFYVTPGGSALSFLFYENEFEHIDGIGGDYYD